MEIYIIQEETYGDAAVCGASLDLEVAKAATEYLAKKTYKRKVFVWLEPGSDKIHYLSCKTPQGKKVLPTIYFIETLNSIDSVDDMKIIYG